MSLRMRKLLDLKAAFAYWALLGLTGPYLVIWFESSEMKCRPYLTMVKSSKHQEHSYKYLIFSPLTEISLTECQNLQE